MIELDRLDEAEETLDNVWNLNPLAEQLWRYRAALHRKRNDWGREIDAIETLCQLDAATCQDLNLLGIAYYHHQDFGRAVECCRQAATAGADPVLWVNLGLMYSNPEISQDADAADAYRRALVLEPGYVRAKEQLEKTKRKLVPLAAQARLASDVDELAEEVQDLEAKLDEALEQATASENYEVAESIRKLRSEARRLHDATMLLTLTPDAVTDEKFKLDEQKRKLFQEFAQLTLGNRSKSLRMEYQTTRDETKDIVNESGNDLERRQLREFIAREHTFLHSCNPKKLESATNELRYLRWQILRRKPDYLTEVFHYYAKQREKYNDPLQAKNLIEAGKRHITMENYDQLEGVIFRLHQLLPADDAESSEMHRPFTGIS